MHILEIQNTQESVWSNQDQIGEVVVQFFANQFTEENQKNNFTMLENILTLITDEDNTLMTRLPNMDEVKDAVFNLNGGSACGPDGFTRLFF